MQQNSFFLGSNYSKCDITDAKTRWSLCPVQDMDTVLTNRYGLGVNVDDDTFSLLYCDLYFRELKERLKHTMLVHESVFESQIRELHRLYWKQKELMMEMAGTRHHEALHLNSGFSIPWTHWLSSSTPHEVDIEDGLLVDNKVEKSEKKVLDLDLPGFECNDMNGEVHETPNQSLRRVSLESGKQSNKLQFDLNEPANLEEHSDDVFNQFLSSVASNEIGGESGIDLNMSPFSSKEEVSIVKKFENEKPLESLSISLLGKHGSEQPQPCSTSSLLLDKRYKSLGRRVSRPRNKVTLGPSPSNETSKGSDFDLHLTAQATSESQVSKEKENSSSLSKVKSARNLTKLGKSRRCKPQMESSNGHKVVKRKKSRRISLVTEGNYQEISAAEAILDMSRKSGLETPDCITSLSRNLLWFAEISSSVDEDMTLQLTKMKLVKHKTNLRLNSSDNKTTVSKIVHGRKRRSRARHGDNRSSSTFSEHGANEDCLQLIGKPIKASESKWNHRFSKNKCKISSHKPMEAFISSMEAKTSVEWGATTKRRRGSRIPATDFQRMIIKPIV